MISIPLGHRPPFDTGPEHVLGVFDWGQGGAKSLDS